MTRQAMKLVRRHAEIENAFGHLSSVRGFAEKSAVLLLSELLVLPSDMTARQWVAHAGLDPRLHESGRSVEASPRMSKVGNVRIRRALPTHRRWVGMPALVAVRWEPNVKAFYEKLLGRGKQPKVALGAVMRKLLHSIYGMLKHDTDFDGEKFYQPALSTS